MGPVPISQETFQLSFTGFPGAATNIWLKPGFPEEDARNQGSFLGEPGSYEVAVILARESSLLLASETPFTLGGTVAPGDSYLAISGPAIPNQPNSLRYELTVGIGDYAVRANGYPNVRGYLSHIHVTEVKARDLDDAADVAYRLIAPTLSSFSLIFDVPMILSAIDSRELRTGAIRRKIHQPYREAALILPRLEMSENFRFYASLWREGLNSASTAHQFLCLFKIIEGLRIRQNRIVISTGDKSGYKETYPSTFAEAADWLSELFLSRPDTWEKTALEPVLLPELAGQSITWIVTDILTPLRTSIAHAVLDNDEPSHYADELTHVKRIEKLLPPTKCIARSMLKFYFPNEFISSLPADRQRSAN